MEWADHALERAEERGITEEQVEWALRKPISQEPGDNGNIVISGFAAGRVLKVVVSADRGTVVTTFWGR